MPDASIPGSTLHACNHRDEISVQDFRKSAQSQASATALSKTFDSLHRKREKC
jgi:hypothetical protein